MIFMDIFGTLVALLMLESVLPLWFLCMKLLGRRRKICKKNYDSQYFISIIIPTYNEESTIDKKLQNILEQTYLGDIEVFVVDGCSEDGTTSIVEEFIKRHPSLKIELIREQTRGGITQAENMVFPRCNGELICISDSDCIWEKEALKEAVANFFDNSIGAVTGSRALLSTKEVTEKMENQYNDFNETLRLGESALDSTPIFRGELAIFRKTLLKVLKVGADAPRADDSEICMSIRKMGYRAVMDDKAVFYEFAPPSIASRTRQKLNRGSGLTQLFLRNWEVIINPKRYKLYSLIVGMNLYMLLISPILVPLIMLFSVIFILGLPLLYIFSTVLLIVGTFIGQYYMWRNRLLVSMISFLHSQFVLLLSFPLLFRRQTRTWKQISEIRDNWARYNQ